MIKITKQTNNNNKKNINQADIPVAVIETCPPEHAVPPFVTVLCSSVSLQGQLPNDDSNDKEEHAESQDAGA